MSWPTRTQASLHCQACGKVIFIMGYGLLKEDFETAERWAAVTYQRAPHKCGTGMAKELSESQKLQKLEMIAQVMKKIRKSNDLTFERECELYSKLLKTYKLK